MKKQATFNSLMTSFDAFRKVKTASELPTEQGTSESSISTPAKDSEVSAQLPNGGDAPSSTSTTKETERGAVAEEKLSDQPTSIPEEELVRKEQSPSAKIASSDDLVARLRAGLTKVASLEADPEAKAQKPKTPASVPKDKATERGVVAGEKLPDQPGTKCASVSVVDGKVILKTASGEEKTIAGDFHNDPQIEALAQKTAEFIQQSELGYQIAQQIFAPTTAKTASAQDIPTIEQVEEVTRQKLAGYVFDSVEGEVANGALTPDQGFMVLTKMGFDVNAVLAERQIESQVNSYVHTRKVAGATDDQIVEELQKLAEADAMAAAEAGALPPEAAGAEGAPEGGGDEAQVAQEVMAAIGELEQAVASGAITEDEALQILEESGLNVEALMAEAQGGGAPAPEGAPAPAPEAAPEAPKEEAPKEESPKEEAAEGEKKEAAGEMPGEAPAPSAAPGQGAPLPPEIEALIAQIDQLLQSGQITEEQAMQAVESILAGGGAPAPEGAGAPMPPEAAGAPMPVA